MIDCVVNSKLWGVLSMENKELYQMIAEIRERTARTETKVDSLMSVNDQISETREIAVEARLEAKDAHERIDSLNKWFYALGSSVLITIVGSILSLIFIN